VKRNGKIGRQILKNQRSRKSPQKKSRKKKECPSGKIRNPKTGRCVSKTSKTGRALLTQQFLEQSESTSGSTLASDIQNVVSSAKKSIKKAFSTTDREQDRGIEKYFTPENCKKYCLSTVGAQPQNVQLTEGQKRYLAAIQDIEDRMGDGEDDDVIEWSELDLEEDFPTDDDEDDLMFMEEDVVVERVPTRRTPSSLASQNRKRSPQRSPQRSSKKPRRVVLQQVSRPKGGNMFI